MLLVWGEGELPGHGVIFGLSLVLGVPLPSVGSGYPLQVLARPLRVRSVGFPLLSLTRCPALGVMVGRWAALSLRCVGAAGRSWGRVGAWYGWGCVRASVSLF